MDIGTFVAKETVLECGQCQRTYPSQELKKLIPPWCNFAYDVLVHVGKSLFLEYRNERNDKTLRTAVTQMQQKISVFDKLREAMRIADPQQNRGLNDDGEDAD